MQNNLKPISLDVAETARSAMLAEAEAIRLAASRLDGNLSKAVEIILNHAGKVVITGMGKSGHIGQKIAATLSSTGTPAVFLHAADATHGDMGIYSPGDPTILISKSGTTEELVRILPLLKKFKSPTIGILGNLNSPIAHQVDVVLDARVEREADPLNLVPTCSSTVAIALGDALAAALMQVRQFSPHDFAIFHPDGQLGKNLTFTIEDIMHKKPHLPCIPPTLKFREVLIELTKFHLGAVCVVGAADQLMGIITDGDIRRSLQKYENMENLFAADLMTVNPISITPDSSLQDAIHLMEDRPSQISVLPVVNKQHQCIGLLRIHDIYQKDYA
jgi:arabinose-5-phosphate isomerase